MLDCTIAIWHLRNCLQGLNWSTVIRVTICCVRGCCTLFLNWAVLVVI
jgi:hypothetical protein